MRSALVISLPPPELFLRYPLTTFFSYVASRCGGVLKIEGNQAELICTPRDLKNAVEGILSKLLEGKLGGLEPRASDAGNKLKDLRMRRSSAKRKGEGTGLCEDVNTVESLVRCYLEKVLHRMDAESYFSELSKAFSAFSDGYVNDDAYGRYSALSILVPEAVEALRIFGTTWSRGTQVRPDHALLRERIRLGFHSIVAGLAGLWLGKLYTDPRTGISTYVLLLGASYVPEAVKGHENLVSYGKAKRLSDLALKILSIFTVSMYGEKVALVKILEGENRCDLISFDSIEVKELLKLARDLDKDTRAKLIRAKLIKALARGDDYSDEIAFRVFVAATNPRLRYSSIYFLARKLLYSEVSILSASDIDELIKILEVRSP